MMKVLEPYSFQFLLGKVRQLSLSLKNEKHKGFNSF